MAPNLTDGSPGEWGEFSLYRFILVSRAHTPNPTAIAIPVPALSQPGRIGSLNEDEDGRATVVCITLNCMIAVDNRNRT